MNDSEMFQLVKKVALYLHEAQVRIEKYELGFISDEYFHYTDEPVLLEQGSVVENLFNCSSNSLKNKLDQRIDNCEALNYIIDLMRLKPGAAVIKISQENLDDYRSMTTTTTILSHLKGYCSGYSADQKLLIEDATEFDKSSDMSLGQWLQNIIESESCYWIHLYQDLYDTLNRAIKGE